MTKVKMNEFVNWAQNQMDNCNVHDEIATSKLIVEIMKRFFTLGKDNQEFSQTVES